MTSILDIIDFSNPDKIAVVNQNDKAATYKELSEWIRDFAPSMDTDQSPHEGDRVIIKTTSPDDTLLIFLSCLTCNLIPIIVNPKISSTKLQYIIEDSKPYMICSDTKDNFIKENIGTKVTDKECAFILYTSGSLGEQKGVCFTNAAALSAINQINQYLNHTSDDIIYNHLPFHHSYGLFQALTILAAGGTIVLEKNGALPNKMLDRIGKYKATGFPTVPTTVSLMLRLKTETFLKNTENLRYVTTAGANLPEEHRKSLQEKLLSTCSIIPMYGATECVRITYNPQINKYPGSTGVLMPDMLARVVDEQGETLPRNEIGELCVFGSNIMNGYLNKPVQEANAFRNGWYHTGDMFYFNDEGYFFFCGRKDDLIKIKGEKVSPIEVESVLNTMEGVEQAIVTTAPDSTFGNVLIVHVVADGTQPDTNEMEVMRFCKQNLEPHLMPKKVIIWPSFPTVEGSNKLDRRYLKEYGIGALKS